MNQPNPEAIPLSYLNALEYCPRRFYYEFVQGEMQENEYILEGKLLHRHVDEPDQQTSEDGEVQVHRLYMYSEALHLVGFADSVEEQDGMLIPVEYKHGRQGKWLNDHIQLCAQAMCLEERQPERPPIAYGYIFYAGSRKRLQVQFTPDLRTRTLAMIERALQIAVRETPPPPLEGPMAKRCRDCSLLTLCLPREVMCLMKEEGTYADALFD